MWCQKTQQSANNFFNHLCKDLIWIQSFHVIIGKTYRADEWWWLWPVWRMNQKWQWDIRTINETNCTITDCVLVCCLHFLQIRLVHWWKSKIQQNPQRFFLLFLILHRSCYICVKHKVKSLTAIWHCFVFLTRQKYIYSRFIFHIYLQPFYSWTIKFQMNCAPKSTLKLFKYKCCHVFWAVLLSDIYYWCCE